MRRLFLAFVFLLLLVACGGEGTSEPLEYPGLSTADDSSSSEEDLDSSSSDEESSSSLFDADTSSEETCIENECFLTDKRDGKTYRIVTIGDQTWMAQSLNYEKSKKNCLHDSCAKYGRLYPWGVVMDSAGEFSTNGLGCGNGRMCFPDYPVRGICPAGWHLPCEAELESLVVVMHEKIMQGKDVWNEFAQSVSPFFTYTHFWSSTEANDSSAYDLLVEETTFSFANHYWPKTILQSVRCIKGKSAEQNMDKWLSFSNMPHSSSSVASSSSSLLSSSSSSLLSSSSSLPESSSSIFVPPCKTETEDNCEYGTLVDDRDGQSYKTVKIGNQWWMAENLNYAYLQPTAELDSSSWCYDNDPENCKKYGRLYLWSAAMDSVVENTGKCGFLGVCDYETKTCTVECNRDGTRGVCPEGWHLPSRWEFEALSQAVGGKSQALKSRDDWQSNNGTDDYGFDAKPAGAFVSFFYLEEVGFDYASKEGVYFGTTDDRDMVYALWLYDNMNHENVDIRGAYKYHAFSVRCLKDTEE